MRWLATSAGPTRTVSTWSNLHVTVSCFIISTCHLTTKPWILNTESRGNVRPYGAVCKSTDDPDGFHPPLYIVVVALLLTAYSRGVNKMDKNKLSSLGT
jgi:hypothetical protein